MSTLLEPLTLRGVTLRNRLALSPMCQYSAHNGFVNEYHVVHDGPFALGGPRAFVEERAAEMSGV